MSALVKAELKGADSSYLSLTPLCICLGGIYSVSSLSQLQFLASFTFYLSYLLITYFDVRDPESAYVASSAYLRLLSI